MRTTPGTIAALLLAIPFVFAVAGVSFAASAGPQAASCGVPAIGSEAAEPNCTSCHNSAALNPDQAGSVRLDGVPPSYEPGRSYPLVLHIEHSDKSLLRWGFQVTAVALADGAGAGEFVVTDSATTQILSSMSGTRSYLGQTYNGTAIGKTGGTSWSFEWKAPATPVGKVGFFAAANAANADGSNQGDRIYSKSPLPIAESGGP